MTKILMKEIISNVAKVLLKIMMCGYNIWLKNKCIAKEVRFSV